MYARYLNAPLLLLVWQVAPIEVRRDEVGRVRFGISGGEGRFSFRDYAATAGGVDCSGGESAGEPAHTEEDAYKVVAASVEGRASNRIRVLGVFGRIEDQSLHRDGQFFAGQAVYEHPRFGLGLGLATFAGPERTLRPSALARVTPAEGVSLQADYHLPGASTGLVGGPRVGLGINQSRHDRLRVFLGLATTPVPDTARRSGAFLESSVPISLFGLRAGISLSAFYAGTRGNQAWNRRAIYSIGVGGWIEP